MQQNEMIEVQREPSKHVLVAALDPSLDVKKLCVTLDRLGHLPASFDGSLLVPLSKHRNEKVRISAIKNIGKLCNQVYLALLQDIAVNDPSTMVRRESISAIGRMGEKKAVPFLITALHDEDPKVILQAVRGLLVFSSEPGVKDELLKLMDHPNEIIQEVICKEFNNHSHDKYKGDHSKSPDYLKNLIVNGDVLDVLKLTPDESIHLTFTSPPYYNARDYSIYQSYDEYLRFLEQVFLNVYRITKEGRFFILNTSPIIIPRVSRQHSSKRYPIPFDIHPLLTKMGWEFIDDIVWVKPEASAKDRNSGFRQHRKPLAYKPNAITEYLMVYRKKTDQLIDWNIRQYDFSIVEESKVQGEIDRINTWNIDPTFDRTHSAVFPLELCLRVIKYYSFKNDLVFDPFGGSGTFSKAAKMLDRHFFSTEISEIYFERIKENIGQNGLFTTFAPPRFLTLKQFSEMIEAVK